MKLYTSKALVLSGITEVSSSYNTTFPFAKKYFTAFMNPKMLGLGDCELEICVEKDISDISYGWLVSIENCSADYDITSSLSQNLEIPTS